MIKKIVQNMQNQFLTYNVLFEKMKTQFYLREKRLLWLFALIYKLCLDIYYLNVMTDQYGYLGLVCSPAALTYLVSWLLYMIGYGMIAGVKDRIISWFLHLQWILTIAPVIVFYGVQSNRSIMYIIYIMAVLFVQTYLGKKKKEMTPISYNGGKIRSYVIVAFCIIIPVVWLIMSLWNQWGGLSLLSFDSRYVYQVRENLYYPPLFGYVVTWVTCAIIPWLFILGLHEKNKFLIFYSLFFQVIYYLLLGYKGYFLLMGVIIIIYLLSKWDILLPGTYVGMIVCTLFGTFSKLLEDFSGGAQTNVFFNSLFGSRALFIPAMIKYEFFEMFSQYPLNFFADGALGKLLSLTSLYDNSLGYTVHAYFNGNFSANANTGYLGDSYAQMGVAGMLFIGTLVILCVRFISNYQRYISPTVLCCMSGCLVVTLNDGAFFTTILTSGFWIMLLMLIVFIHKGEEND